MTWHDTIALAAFALAAVFVIRRAYRSLFGPAKGGCGTACRPCGKGGDLPPTGQPLLSIGPPPEGPSKRHG